MKVVLLAGGFGTRITEESYLKPKPMIEIDDQPILWHIMKIYSYYGFNDFIICAGYKQQVIKEYFATYYLHHSDITWDFSQNNRVIIHNNVAEPWKVTVLDTGLYTMTGGRIKRAKQHLGNETFMMTYGDGLCGVNLKELLDFHRSHGKLATLTAIQPGGRFGTLDIQSDHAISRFSEKNKEDGGWINGGFMVLEPQVLDYIEGDNTTFEKEPLENLSRDNQLMAYKFEGFWKCMDTLRDKMLLQEMLEKDVAPWTIWKK